MCEASYGMLHADWNRRESFYVHLDNSFARSWIQISTFYHGCQCCMTIFFLHATPNISKALIQLAWMNATKKCHGCYRLSTLWYQLWRRMTAPFASFVQRSSGLFWHRFVLVATIIRLHFSHCNGHNKYLRRWNRFTTKWSRRIATWSISRIEAFSQSQKSILNRSLHTSTLVKSERSTHWPYCESFWLSPMGTWWEWRHMSLNLKPKWTYSSTVSCDAFRLLEILSKYISTHKNFLARS